MHPELVKSYVRFCQFRQKKKENGRLDFTRAGFLFPTVLLPSISHLSDSKSYIPPIDPAVANYVEVACNGRANGTVAPIVEIPKEQTEFEQIIQNLYGAHLSNGRNCGGANAFKYAVGEMVDNVYQHSRFERAFVMGQSYPTKKFTEICIVDDGKTIPGLFSEHGFTYSTDGDAVVAAIGGKTTKTDEYGRGYGLGTTLNLIVNGLNGEVLIASRKSAVYLGPEKKTTIYALDANQSFDGTLIAFRIPYAQKPIEDYTKYIETRIDL